MVPGLEARGLVAPRMTSIGNIQTCPLLAQKGEHRGRWHTTASLDCVTTLPNHCADRSAQHVYQSCVSYLVPCILHFGVSYHVESRRTCNETLEERLVGQIFVVLLEVLFGRSHELDCGKLVAANCVNVDILSVDAACTTDHLPTLLETRDDVANESTLYTRV